VGSLEDRILFYGNSYLRALLGPRALGVEGRRSLEGSVFRIRGGQSLSDWRVTLPVGVRILVLQDQSCAPCQKETRETSLEALRLLIGPELSRVRGTAVLVGTWAREGVPGLSLASMARELREGYALYREALEAFGPVYVLPLEELAERFRLRGDLYRTRGAERDPGGHPSEAFAGEAALELRTLLERVRTELGPRSGSPPTAQERGPGAGPRVRPEDPRSEGPTRRPSFRGVEREASGRVGRNLRVGPRGPTGKARGLGQCRTEPTGPTGPPERTDREGFPRRKKDFGPTSEGPTGPPERTDREGFPTRKKDFGPTSEASR